LSFHQGYSKVQVIQDIIAYSSLRLSTGLAKAALIDSNSPLLERSALQTLPLPPGNSLAPEFNLSLMWKAMKDRWKHGYDHHATSVAFSG
jgi:hypothetical protein